MTRRARLALAGPLVAAVGIVCFVATGSTAATLVVTNTSDVVNGDTSSPAALIANPGPDGISLREAIEATEHETFDLVLPIQFQIH